MSPKRFGIVDWITSAVAAALLIFLFTYPHSRINALSEDMTVLCDRITLVANDGDWFSADGLAADMHTRFLADETMLRFVVDHEDVDTLSDAVESVLLMVERRDGTETAIETQNVRTIVLYLSQIETFTLINLF